MKKWYVVYTNSRAEKKVAGEFSKAGIEHYLPLYKIQRQWSDRVKWVEVPLFPSYIFVFIDLTKEYSIVAAIPGVACFIKLSEKPVPIPTSEIDKIKTVMASGIPVLAQNSAYLTKGDPIEVTEGSLKGLKGELIGLKGKKKVLIRLDVIDKNILIDIPLTMIRKFG